MAKNYRFLLRYISRRAVELFDAPYEFPSCTRWPDRVVHLMKPREVELTPGTTLLYKTDSSDALRRRGRITVVGYYRAELHQIDVCKQGGRSQ